MTIWRESGLSMESAHRRETLAVQDGYSLWNREDEESEGEGDGKQQDELNFQCRKVPPWSGPRQPGDLYPPSAYSWKGSRQGRFRTFEHRKTGASAKATGCVWRPPARGHTRDPCSGPVDKQSLQRANPSG